jgi:hypothetical protein
MVHFDGESRFHPESSDPWRNVAVFVRVLARVVDGWTSPEAFRAPLGVNPAM